MSHAHALLVLAAAIFVIGAGIVILALGWRRSYRGERSGMVVGALSPRATVLSYAAVPVGGLAALLLIVVAAAALR